MVGDQLLSDGSSLEGWQSLTQVNPYEVFGWTVQLIGYDKKMNHAYITEINVNDKFKGKLGGKITKALGKKSKTVAAIVMYDEPTESLLGYAPYELTVNGDLQPGGGTG